MNKLYSRKVNSTIRLFGCVCTAIMLSACAGVKVVELDPSVEQLKDLNDYDRDGVIEAREKCADTVIGARIDNYGCGVKTSHTRPFNVDIKFAHNSYEIPPLAFDKIKELSRLLEENQELQALIEGHTSSVGSVSLNQTLSNNRAKAIVSVLINDFNIAPERLSSVGYGFERLVDFGDTEAAHAVNRRIMVELSETVSVDDMKWTIYTVDQVQ